MPVDILGLDLNPATVQVAGGGAVMLALSFGLRALLRRLAEDRNEGKTDLAEQNLIARLEVQNAKLSDALDRCFSERNEYAVLAAEVPLLKQRITELIAEVRDLRERLFGKGGPLNGD